jgi:hypothetical protein
MRLWKYLPAVAALACTGIVIAPALPANAAGPSVKLNGKTSLPNTKAGAVVSVTGSGFPANDANLWILECNGGSDSTGSGCNINNHIAVTSDGSGNVPATPYTLTAGPQGTDTTLTCLPPAAAQISAGESCGLIIVDITAQTTEAQAPFYDAIKISEKAATAGHVKVTCKNVANAGVTALQGGTKITEMVNVVKNGTTVATVANSGTTTAGTVTATIAAVTGDKVSCVGQKLKQKSKTLTLP